MATEFKLSYTGSQINEKLSKIDSLATKSELPTKTSDLANDSGFLTSIPSEYVTETELSSKGYLTEHQDLSGYALKTEIPSVPVQSVNGQTGAVNLSAIDVGALPNTTVIPSIDGLASESYVDSKIAAIPTPDVSGHINTHNTAANSHNDIRDLINGLTTRLNTLANSDDTTLDQMSEVVAYIKSNKSLIDAITTNKVNVADIINNLTTNVSNKPLSAAQGVALKALIDAIVVPTKVSELTNDKGYITDYTETDPTVPSWAKASTKPSYTASEVGLGNVDNVKQYSASNPPPYPVTKVNNKTGVVTLSASDVGADASGTASSLVSAHNTNTGAHSDIRERINELATTAETLSENIATIINIKEKYDIDDTGSVDCSAQINQAISEANTRDTLFLPNGTYRIDNTVTVNKSINLQFEGVIKYYGTDFAFLFKNFNHSTAKFNEIRASSGSCIKLYSNWSGESNFIQYSHFIFQKLKAKLKSEGGSASYCIFAQSENSGWINENRFTGGKMESGHYGFYVDCGGKDNFNGNLFDSCAAEGETGAAALGVGFYLANGCRNNMLFRCRHSESFENFLVTVGLCYGLKIISTSAFNMSQNSISENTTGFVIASLPAQNSSRCESKGAFVRGTLVCEKHDNTKYLSTVSTSLFDMTNLLDYTEEYNNFVVGGSCSSIKLNKKYGYADGINEFYVRFPSVNTETFTITDCDGNAINYIVPKIANSVVKFNWFSETGWQYSYDFSNSEQIKDLIAIEDYARNDEVVKTVNNTYPDENGNIEIVVVEEDPIVVGSIAECVDTTKKYVLPDGYIYAYRKRFYPGSTTPNFTNQLPLARSLDGSNTPYNGVGYKYGTTSMRLHNGQFIENDITSAGYKLYSLGLIPIKIGDVVRVNRIACDKRQGHADPLFGIVQTSKSYSQNYFYQNGAMDNAVSKGLKFTVEETANLHTIYKDIEIPINKTLLGWIADEPISWLICNFTAVTPPEEVIITVNEEITYTVTEDRYEWSWENTGKLYDESGYSDMINALEERVEILETNSGTSLTTENWTFTLEDGSTVTKAVCLK